MDNPNPIYYKDLVTPDNAITNLLDQLDALISKFGEAKTKIQGEAAQVAKAMENVSSATEEQRKQIQLVTEQTDRLAKAYKESGDAESAAYRRKQEITMAIKEQQQIDKLLVQINTSVEGSYNRLSAQYRLNKIRLNEMSAAERAGTEAGRALEQETNALYEEMKRLQEATGKHQLNVGNYADAAKGLRAELMSLTQQMALMKLEGKGNTEEYRNMAERAGVLKDAMTDASEEVRHTADDTRNLNAVMGALVIGGTGLAVVSKAMGAFGESSEGARKAEQGLGVVMAGVMGLTVVKNNLQKQSNLMVGIGTLQTKAATVADKLREVQTKKSIIATKAATVAQKAFNAVASANPYVLLAAAVLSVVGALALYAAGSKEAEEQERHNINNLADLQRLRMEIGEDVTIGARQRQKDFQRELDIARAQKKSLEEQRQLEKQVLEYRQKELDELERQAGIWASERGFLSMAQAVVDLESKLKESADGLTQREQEELEYQKERLNQAIKIRDMEKDLAKDRALYEQRLVDDQKKAAQTSQKIVRDYNKSRIELIEDTYEREQASLRENAKNQIADIRERLKTETELTLEDRRNLNAQIVNIQIKLNRDLDALEIKRQKALREAVRGTQDLEIELMADGAEKQRKTLAISYQRRIEDLQTTLKTEKSLTAEQRAELEKQIKLLQDISEQALADLDREIAVGGLEREKEAIELRLDAVAEGSQEEIDLRVALLEKERQIALATNRQLAADERQDEAAINAKYNAMILQQTTEMTTKRAELLLQSQQDLAQSEFDLLSKNERQKTQFQLSQEKARLQQILELNKTAGVKMSAEQVKTIENQIKAIEKASKTTPFNNLYEVLGIGLNSEQQQAMSTVISETMNNISEMINMWVQEADAAIQAADKKVSAAQAALDAEIQARNEGYANNVIQAQKNLALEKQNQQKAIEEKKKAQKVQLALDTATQVSSLVTASANIWAGFTAIQPAPLGLALAIAGLATLWGSFAASKSMAIAQATKSEQYADGTVELLQGGSHASGHDIDLGTKTDGTRRRAEGGEYFAVINKRNSRRFGDIIPDVINAFNDGTFAEKYQRANSDMAGVALAMVTGPNGATDVSALERGVDAIVKQGERTRFVDGDGNTVEVYKNVTTKILKS